MVRTGQPDDHQAAAGPEELSHPLERNGRSHVMQRGHRHDGVERPGIERVREDVPDDIVDAHVQHPTTTCRQRPQDDRAVVDVVVPPAVVRHRLDHGRSARRCSVRLVDWRA
jgi:hypothetical protein